VKIRNLRLANFRNIASADIPLDHHRIFLLGANGQGKTNLLEAIGLLPALRSFRTQDTTLLTRHGTPAAQAGYTLTHETEGTVEVALTLEPRKKTVRVDGSPIRHLSEYLGRFPTVPFCTTDIELLRGPPATRRRWLDMVIAAHNAQYLHALRRYHTALAGRNQLLRHPAPDTAQLLAFEKTLAPCAETITAGRRDMLAQLATALALVCAQSGLPESTATLAYTPNAPATDATAWLELFARQRPTDILLHATQRGPHRDDFTFLLKNHPARDIASEGQQRGIVLGLELAWLSCLRTRSAVAPIILADDILGELDPRRKACFWRALDATCQVIATGTTPPDTPEHWHIMHVNDGHYT
jgi:DNA replication and repair protein RecF